MNDYQKELLQNTLEARRREVVEYETNITNYALALERIGDDPDLVQFGELLAELMRTAKIECKKAKIMLDVVESQL